MGSLESGSGLVLIDAGVVETAGQRARTAALVLAAAVACVVRAVPDDWSGVGRQASVAAAADLRNRLEALKARLETAGLALLALAAALRSVQAELAAARRVLASAGPLEVDGPVSHQVELARNAFERADQRAAALLTDALLRSLVGRPPGVDLAAGAPSASARALASEVAAIPRIPATAAGVALWWAGLSGASRLALTNTWPFLPAGLDGVPARVRDAINRRRLASEIRQAAVDYDHAPAGVVHWLGKDTARVTTLQRLAGTLARPASELLVFDGTGDGRAVVSSGDVDSSRNVAVVVPGMSTDLADVPRLVGQENRLAAASGAVAITWLGYDAPGLRQVISDGRAKSGAAALQRFTAGLRSTAGARQHVTVIGHSYGTLVAGIAAREGLATDDLVLLASPGVEASHASQLHLPAGHVWAARTFDDPIQLVFWPAQVGKLFDLPVPQVFGPDPASSAFGAQHFGTGGAHGHSGYFTAGSRSLDNLGRIVSERPVRP